MRCFTFSWIARASLILSLPTRGLKIDITPLSPLLFTHNRSSCIRDLEIHTRAATVLPLELDIFLRAIMSQRLDHDTQQIQLPLRLTHVFTCKLSWSSFGTVDIRRFRWTSNGRRRRPLFPSGHQLSSDPPADPLCTILFLRTRLYPYGDLDLSIGPDGTFPSDPTVSRFINVVAWKAMVFDSPGIDILQLYSRSVLSVLTTPAALSARPLPLSGPWPVAKC